MKLSKRNKILCYLFSSFISLLLINTAYASRSFDYFNINLSESGKDKNSTKYYNYVVTLPTDGSANDEIIQGDAEGKVETASPVTIAVSKPGVTSGDIVAILTITDPLLKDKVIIKGKITYSAKNTISLSTNQMYTDANTGIQQMQSQQPGKDAPAVNIVLIGSKSH